MRLLRTLAVVTAGLEPEGGGAAALSRLVVDSAAAFGRRHDMDVEVLDLGRAAPAPPGATVHHFAGRQAALARAVWMRALVRQTAFVFTHLGPARTVALLPRWLTPPYLVWMLGVEAWRPLSLDRRRVLRHAAARVAISRFTERRARHWHPWLPPVDVLHPILDERDGSGHADERLLERIGPQAILIVGRMAAAERYKGHDELLDAMPAILRACPAAQLVMAGGGDDLPRVQALADSLGIGNHVVATGFVNEATLRRLYDRCRVFAMPSRDEGFGLVFLEAMRAGRPCVALRDSSAAEIVEDGVTGLLVDDTGADRLSAAVRRLLGDDALAARLGDAGRHRWATHFTRAAFDNRLHALLARICGVGPPAGVG